MLKSLFPPHLFGIYDDLTSEHAPGLQKYDLCMTKQVSGLKGVKIVGRHMASSPKMVTERFQFGPWEAVIIVFKEGRGPKSMSSPKDWVDLFKLNFLCHIW